VADDIAHDQHGGILRFPSDQVKVAADRSAAAGPSDPQARGHGRGLLFEPGPRSEILAVRYPEQEDHMAQTKAQRSAAAKKAAATRKRNAAKKSAKEVKSSARSTGRSVTDLAKAAGSTAQSAAKSVAKRADAARKRIG
jgi:hypothetical protein